MAIQYASSEKMANLDKVAIEKYGLPVLQMMENAGRNMAEFVHNIAKKEPKKIAILYGKGNNGGDGLAAARHLAIKGHKISIVPTSPEKENNENTKNQLKILKKSGIKPQKAAHENPDIIIDSLLGYNAKGNPKKKYAELINWSNKQKEKGSKVVAFDIPSGLDPDTGKPQNPCIKADYILTLAAPKKGFKELIKTKVYLASIGIPLKAYKDAKIKIPRNTFSNKEIIKH